MAQSSAPDLRKGDDRLSLLYRVSQTFNSSLDLDQVLNLVMDQVVAATRAERGFLMLRDAGDSLSFRVARGMDQNTIDQPEFQVSRGVVERVNREGQPLLASNVQADHWLSGRESVALLGLRSILCVPLQLKGASLGVIYVDNRLQAGLFSPADLDLLTAIAANAAVAIDNARLYQVAVEKGRMERELQVAREVQLSLLPHETPQLPGWEFAARWRPAHQVAGDFYDFIPGVGVPAAPPVGRAPGPPARLGIAIADVADKGMPAALFMALSRSTVRASLTAAASPAEGIAQANRLICADAADGMFVTLFYAQLDPDSGELTYVNAGHNPPLLGRAGSAELTRLMPTAMALGIEETAPVRQETIRLQPGDFLVMYTDGMTEAVDAHDEPFGEARLHSVLLAHGRDGAAQVLDAMLQALDGFRGDQDPFDDTTVVVVRRE